MRRFSNIAEVMASYPERFSPEKALGVEGIVQFIFTGDGGGVYSMIIRDQQVHVAEGDEPDATVVVTAPADAWLQVNNGETSPMGLLMRGQLKVEGSLALATRLQSLFRPGTEL